MKLTKEMKNAGLVMKKTDVFYNDCIINLPVNSSAESYIEKTVIPLIKAGYSLYSTESCHNYLWEKIRRRTGHRRDRWDRCTLHNIIHQVCVRNWYSNEWCREADIVSWFS